MFQFYKGCYHASNSCKCTGVHAKAGLAGTHMQLRKKREVYTTIHIRICINSDSVLQATCRSCKSCEHLYQGPCLASRTFCGEQGSGHAAADELSPKNTIIEQCSLMKCWHPLNRWCNCYYGCNLRRTQILLVTASFCCGDKSLVASATRPFLSVKGVACKTSTTRPTCYICTWYDTEGSYDKIKIHKYHLFVAFSIVNHAAHTQQYQQHQIHDIVLYHGDTYMDRCSSD